MSDIAQAVPRVAVMPLLYSISPVVVSNLHSPHGNDVGVAGSMFVVPLMCRLC